MKQIVAARLRELAKEHDLPHGAAARLERLLEALADEPVPHTSVVAPEAAVNQHIADSLSGLRADALRQASTIVDIGSGAGFPGLPLAIALPDALFDLLESARRKCAVIESLAAAAGLDNVRAIAVRTEEWAAGSGGSRYDVATARAVAPLPVLVEYAAPLLRAGGTLVAWKGARNAVEEIAGERAAGMVGLRPAGVIPVTPFPAARELNLYLYVKEAPTSERFPRRSGIAAKRPLA